MRFAVADLEPSGSDGSESDAADGLFAPPQLQQAGQQEALEQPTPQSALAATLLASLRAGAPLAMAARLLPAAAAPEPSAAPAAPAAPPASSAPAVGGSPADQGQQQQGQGPAPGSGVKWWQAVVRPELADQRAAAAVAAAAAAPTPERASPWQQQQQQAPPLALAPLASPGHPPLPLPQVAALAEALLSELLRLLTVRC